MRQLPSRARRVILGVTVSGLACWLGLVWLLQPVPPDMILAVALFFVAAVATEFLAVPLPKGGDVAISTVVHVAGILLLPLPLVGVLAGLAMLAQQLVARAPWYKAAFNIASLVLTIAVTGASMRLLGNPLALAQSEPRLSIVSLFIVAFTYYLVTSTLLWLLFAALQGRPIWYIVRANTSSTLLEITPAVIGGVVAFIWSHTPWWTVAMVFPAAIAYLALRYLQRVVTETDSAVAAIAQIVDERDHYTYEHSSHVGDFTELLARAMQLDPFEVDVIVSAARVHDLGKIGVSDFALQKKGPLDPAERTEMETHPVVGARILNHFEGYRKGADLVLHHHEHWDGSGYPDGLKGEQIPLGARIIAIADAFDAMTTDRPYRAALPIDEALNRIRKGAGTQFDPVVAGHFLSLEWELRAMLSSRPLPLRGCESSPAAPAAERHRRVAVP